MSLAQKKALAAKHKHRQAGYSKRYRSKHYAFLELRLAIRRVQQNILKTNREISMLTTRRLAIVSDMYKLKQQDIDIRVKNA